MPTSSGKTAKIVVGTPLEELCDGLAVQVTTDVTPPVNQAGTLVIYTYMLIVDNIGTETATMTKIRHLLPTGFFYGPGST